LRWLHGLRRSLWRFMSLFSKLFSRDDKEPGEPKDADASAPGPDATDAATRGDSAAVGGAAARDPNPPPAAKKTENTAVATSSDKKGSDLQPEAASAKQTGTSGTRAAEAAAKPPPLKPGAQAKPDRPRTKTMQGMNVGGSTNAAVPPPPAATRTEAKANQPAAQAGQSPAPRADAAVAKQAVVPIGGEPQAEPRTQPQPGAAAAQIPDLPSAEIPTLELQTTSAQLRKSNAPFDVAFDAVMNALVDPDAPSTHAHSNHDASDRRALAETFADVAKVHAHPLRELMFQLGVGRTPRQWALNSRPVLKPLLDAAQQIGMLELVGALGAFDAALERASADPSPCIGDAAAESLKHAYQRLCIQLPDAFTPENSDGRRMVLLESLLLQIPAMHRRTLAKLYAAGLNSLSQLSQASADELSAVAGIERELAQSLVEHVQRFERERLNIEPAEARSRAIERLRALLGRISELQEEFEEAESRGSVAHKRDARRKREGALLELDLVFAEIGELAMIEELKRSSVQGRLRRVALYIDELRASA
jgi:hypothetical protein